MGADRTDNDPESDADAEPELGPDEYDPEAEFHDPESDSLTIPQVSSEDAGGGLWSDLRDELEDEETTEPTNSTEEVDVPPELLRTFWALVLIINVALLAYALGVLFLIFEGATRTSGGFLVIGLVCTAFAVRRYRNYQRTSDATDDESTPEASSERGVTTPDEPTDDT
ncbi:hypothetical protein [Haloterrigena salinisoli]|uniref:DUF7322 domain-containing protein n=1 Tax=Haloterrigena salinisoli TaxID=3132747 RepID=UPI0030CFD914